MATSFCKKPSNHSQEGHIYRPARNARNASCKVCRKPAAHGRRLSGRQVSKVETLSTASFMKKLENAKNRFCKSCKRLGKRIQLRVSAECESRRAAKAAQVLTRKPLKKYLEIECSRNPANNCKQEVGKTLRKRYQIRVEEKPEFQSRHPRPAPAGEGWLQLRVQILKENSRLPSQEPTMFYTCAPGGEKKQPKSL